MTDYKKPVALAALAVVSVIPVWAITKRYLQDKHFAEREAAGVQADLAPFGKHWVSNGLANLEPLHATLDYSGIKTYDALTDIQFAVNGELQPITTLVRVPTSTADVLILTASNFEDKYLDLIESVQNEELAATTLIYKTADGDVIFFHEDDGDE